MPTGLDLALYWAERGFPVTPVQPNTKAPSYGRDWQLDGTTTDPEKIRQLWARRPGAWVGIRTGRAPVAAPDQTHGPDVVDVDVKEGAPGLASLDRLTDLGLVDGWSMRVRTRSGGVHLYFLSGSEQGLAKLPWAGVDFRARAGLIVAPGNSGYTVEQSFGGSPSGVAWQPIAEALPKPDGWDEAQRAKRVANNGATVPARQAVAAPVAPTMPSVPLPAVPQTPARASVGSRLVAPSVNRIEGKSPLDDYAERGDLGTLLESDGWTFAHESGGNRHYARPGKSVRDGVSGNIKVEGGRQVFYAFSSGGTLPENEPLSAGEVYAHIKYGSTSTETMKQVTRDLRAEGYGDPLPERTPAVASAGPSANREAPAATGTRTEDRRLPVTLREAASAIWGEREVLARIRQTARARFVGEWALLGAVLAHVACRIGPHVKLPPTIGSAASLNVYIGLVGGSSGGKDAAMDVAAEMFAHSSAVVPVLEPATGQGLEAAYTASTKEGPVQYNDTALFKVSEIGSVSAHASMNASTLMPTLLKMFMAQQLGAAYATEEKRRPVRQHGYRAAIIAGIQPAKSELLLNQDAVDAGTAQRWLFMPVNQDEDRSRFAAPNCDASISWRTPGTGAATLRGWHDRPEWAPCGDQRSGNELDPVEVKETLIIEICEQARTEIIDARRARNKLDLFEQTVDSIDGHALLTQLKVAALLGLLDGRFEVSDDDWRLARLVMGVSRDTRDICYRVLRSVQSKKNRARAEFDAEREVVKAEETDKAATAKTCNAIMTKLGKAPGGELVRKQLYKIDAKLRPHFDQATELLEQTGRLVIERRPNQAANNGTATYYRLTGR
ncbi:bifunctional DNA primase/polymerase [Micromonospora sp. NPDC048170]|uniref:bifunctional DNA primase/polymerase n=1 Tax=Micromonospora sp. NPDC048170 TaxID=3154819 RepID=UPI0033EE05E5